MKLGEALSLRAKQAQKMNDLKARIRTSAQTQEGTAPPEDPDDLVEQYLTVSEEHATLVTRIALTNASTNIDDVLLIALLQQREQLIRERNIYGFAADAASGGKDAFRFMRSELKYETSLDIADLRATEDEVSERIRILDAQIQQVNWTTDLLQL